MADGDVRAAVARTVPVALALVPVGILFGLSAAQVGWTLLDVFLLGGIGFTGSGQFTYLRIHSSGVSAIVVYVLITLINLRYFPMLLSLSRRVGGSVPARAVQAHIVSDESYAVEQLDDSRPARIAIRLSIWCYWVFAGMAGVLIADALPGETSKVLAGFTFPASALLAALGIIRAQQFVQWQGLRAIWAIAAVSVVALVLIRTLGPRYFWIPSIVVGSAIVAWWLRRSEPR